MGVGAAAIVGGIGAAGSLFGGMAQADAAENAANLQYQAAQQANALQYQMYQQNRTDMAPWRETGARALGTLDYLMGDQRPEYFNKDAYSKKHGIAYSHSAAKDVPQWIKGTPGGLEYGGNDSMAQPSGEGWSWQPDYMNGGGNWVRNKAGTPDVLNPAYNPDDKDQRSWTDPYDYWTKYGKTAGDEYLGLDSSFGTLSKKFDKDAFLANKDPGYEWRTKQGLEALKAAGAASGMYGSGNLGTALVDYGQNQASAEYQSAYNRYTQDQTNLYNKLANMAGMGQTQSQALANLSANTANQIGMNTIAGANALAGGQIGAANAWGNALTGVSNQLMGGIGTYMKYNALQNMMGGGGGWAGSHAASDPYTASYYNPAWEYYY